MVMKFLRKKKNMRIILWSVAILIIPGFLIWGVGVGGGRGAQYYAAVVNREPITLREYYQSLREIEDEYRNIFGEDAGEILKSFNIEQIALENLIRERLLLQEARRRRIRVLDREIVDVIKREPVFRGEDGEFDEQRFRDIISHYPSEELRRIEDEIRENMMIQKLRERVIAEGMIEVSDEEVEKYIENHQIKDVDSDAIRRTLLWQKQEEYFNRWYSELARNSDIKVYLSLNDSPESEQGDME